MHHFFRHPSELTLFSLESHLDTLFRIVHSSNFNTSTQAMMLIHQLSASRNIATDRLYRVLYESLLDIRLSTSSKQAMYLNLIMRTLKSDMNIKRVKAFVKRMLQVLTLHQPPFICGALYVIIQLEALVPGLATLIAEPEEHRESRQIDSHDELGSSYNGRKRNPEFSNADRSCLWELVSTLSLWSYNPFTLSVNTFAYRCLF